MTGNTENEKKARSQAFVNAVHLLQTENRRQRALPDCSAEHWGWIERRRDRARILKDVGNFGVRANRPSYCHFVEIL